MEIKDLLQLKFYNAFTEGTKLVFMSLENNKVKRRLIKHDWYFYITKEDCKKITDDIYKNWIDTNLCEKIIPDENYPDKYYRIYCKNDLWRKRNRILKKYKKDENYNNVQYIIKGGIINQIEYANQITNSNSRLEMLRSKLEHLGINHLEMDVSPLKRFMIDNDVKIDTDLNILYYDIETDDTIRGFDNLEEKRILSIAWANNTGQKGFLIADENNDESEKELLKKFYNIMLQHHVIVGWNSYEFDDKVLLARYEYHGAIAENAIDWRSWIFMDLMKLFKKHWIKAGEVKTSYALDNVGKHLLGIQKIDIQSKIIDLYNDDREKLEKYNVRDVDILKGIAEYTGYVELQLNINSIGCTFGYNTYVSYHVDMLMLKLAYKYGKHFPTLSREDKYDNNDSEDGEEKKKEKFEGAYVKEPVKGLHNNIASVDFKALYPSTMIMYNISPEVYIPAENRDKYKWEELTHCPVPAKTTYLKNELAFVPQLFIMTTEKRKQYTDLMKTVEPDSDLYKLYDGKAYAYKAFGLSIYGAIGQRGSRYYSIEMAESVTLGGQYFIKQVEKIAADKHIASLYGDSVTGRRMLLIRNTETKMLENISFEDLFNKCLNKNIIKQNNGKEYIYNIPYETISINKNYELQFKSIKYIVRHKTNKNIYRIYDNKGETEITEDHSLLDFNFNQKKYNEIDLLFNVKEKIKDLKIKEINKIDLWQYVKDVDIKEFGNENKRKQILDYDDNWIYFKPISINPKYKCKKKIIQKFKRFISGKDLEALCDLIGSYVTEGSSSTPHTTDTRYMWSISNNDKLWLEKLKIAIERLVIGCKFSIIISNKNKNSITYALRSGTRLLSYIFKALCNQLSTGMKLPSFVYHLSKNNKIRILNNAIFGDGTVRNKSKKMLNFYLEKYSYTSQSIKLSNNFCILISLLDNSFSINYYKLKKTWNLYKNNKSKNLIPKYEKIDYNDYVYDIEVNDNHNFIDTMGFTVLKNTDSQYIQIERENIQPFLDQCQLIFEKIAKETNAVKQQQLLEFEDYYGSMIFVAKKRYAGHLTWCKGVECSTIRAKGLEYIRTDISHRARMIQYELLEKILKENVDKNYCKKYISELKEQTLNYKLPIDDIIITQSISQALDKYKTKGAHIQVAEDIIKNKEEFYIGMKVPYIVVKSKPKILAIHSEHYNDKEYHNWFKKEHEVIIQTNAKTGEQKITEMFPDKNEEIKYDSTYYFDNKLYPPSKRILQIVFNDFNWESFTVAYKEKYNRKIDLLKKALSNHNKLHETVKKIKKDEEINEEDKKELRKIYNKTLSNHCNKLIEKYEKGLKNWKRYKDIIIKIKEDKFLRSNDKEYLRKIYLDNIELHKEKEIKAEERKRKAK